MIHATVSILSYNGGDKTIRTISDILSQNSSNIKIELVIIDNCSSNKIVNRIKRIFPKLNIIVNSSNLGFSGGNNVAIKIARNTESDFLFILNDDIQVKPDYIQEMINTGVNLTDAGVLGSTIILKGGKVQAVCGYLYPWYAGVFWTQKKIRNNQYSVRKVDVIQGAAFMLTKAALKRGFMFDECLFFGGEEYDLGYWSRINGLKIYVLEHIEVLHDTNQKEIITNRWHPDPIQNYYAIRNSIYIKLKYDKKLFFKFVSISYSIFRIIIKAFIFGLRGNKNMIIYMLRGFHDGVLKKMGIINNSKKIF